MDMQFLQDLKEHKHLSDFSQETIDFAVKQCEKYSLKEIFDKYEYLFLDDEKN